MVPSNHSNFQYCDSNIGLFSIAPSKVITLNPLCIFFVSVLCFFFYGSLSKVIALPNIATVQVYIYKGFEQNDKNILVCSKLFDLSDEAPNCSLEDLQITTPRTKCGKFNIYPTEHLCILVAAPYLHKFSAVM